MREKIMGKKGNRHGFTLIEMLVVIAIIGILAGLTLAVLPGLKGKANRARIRTDLEKIETVIKRYKEKKHVWPPDNQRNPTEMRPEDLSQPPLFYELTGTIQLDGPKYQSKHAVADPPLDVPTLKAAFGIEGFVNTSSDKSEVDNFFSAALNPSDIALTPDGVKVLVAPYKGADGQLARWFYNSTRPVHNPGEYDLWTEIIMGGKKEIIGNWKD
jgi:prepilin-type N-terminal cleavage/methylation domain-containing protein